MPLAATQTLMAAHRTAIDLERDRLEEEAAENGVELPDTLELSPEAKREMDVAFRDRHTANKDNLTDLTKTRVGTPQVRRRVRVHLHGSPRLREPSNGHHHPRAGRFDGLRREM